MPIIVRDFERKYNLASRFFLMLVKVKENYIIRILRIENNMLIKIMLKRAWVELEMEIS